jgi:hypothetical protein
MGATFGKSMPVGCERTVTILVAAVESDTDTGRPALGVDSGTTIVAGESPAAAVETAGAAAREAFGVGCSAGEARKARA